LACRNRVPYGEKTICQRRKAVYRKNYLKFPRGDAGLPQNRWRKSGKLAGAEVPDLVLVDIKLLDMSGYDVARRLRANRGARTWRPAIRRC
jgi:DNA-binding response OmpR family regulator